MLPWHPPPLSEQRSRWFTKPDWQNRARELRSEKDPVGYLNPLLHVSRTFSSLVLVCKTDSANNLHNPGFANHPELMHYHIFPFFNLLQTTECVACAKWLILTKPTVRATKSMLCMQNAGVAPVREVVCGGLLLSPACGSGAFSL